MSNPVFTLELVEAEQCFTTIEVHKSGHGRMEFRGDGMQMWGSTSGDGSTDHIRSHGKHICWAEWLHNVLEGWHTCIFYADDKFSIHDQHPDYKIVSQLWDFGLMSDKEVLAKITA